jgi:hypothetical protein
MSVERRLERVDVEARRGYTCELDIARAQTSRVKLMDALLWVDEAANRKPGLGTLGDVS